MDRLEDLMAYLIYAYPSQWKDDISNARLTKMIYLADWHSCINGRGRLTDIRWYFDNFGPFVWNISDTAKGNPDIFTVTSSQNMYGSQKRIIGLSAKVAPQVSPAAKESLDHIISVTAPLTWDKFIQLVYSTYPITSSERYQYFDLEEKAQEYLQAA
jgi:hypothetical protein